MKFYYNIVISEFDLFQAKIRGLGNPRIRRDLPKKADLLFSTKIPTSGPK